MKKRVRYGRKTLWANSGWSGMVTQQADDIGQAIEQEFDYLMHRDNVLLVLYIERLDGP